MLVCRVIRFTLARFKIDSNRWLLISYKQWLFHERSTVNVGEVIDDCSNTVDDNTLLNDLFSLQLLKLR